MHNQQHPDTELLDRLRAGLLDDQADERATLESHLASCAACQARFNSWQQLAPQALGPRLEAHKIGDELQRARHRALNVESRPAPAYAAYATAALLLIAVSVGLWSLQPGPVTPPQLTAQNTNPAPDLYEDLDFYLWLANQEEGPANAETNPNNS
jgi:anti-sigma factor RsiW